LRRLQGPFRSLPGWPPKAKVIVSTDFRVHNGWSWTTRSSPFDVLPAGYARRSGTRPAQGRGAQARRRCKPTGKPEIPALSTDKLVSTISSATLKTGPSLTAIVTLAHISLSVDGTTWPSGHPKLDYMRFGMAVGGNRGGRATRRQPRLPLMARDVLPVAVLAAPAIS